MRSDNKNLKIQATAARNNAACLEQLENRRYQSGNHEIGINVNDNSDGSVERALPALKALGITSVRLWYSVYDWDSTKISSGLARAIDYHNAGYDVTLTIANGDKAVPNTADVHKWFGWAANNPALKKAVDRWEIGNEVDSPYYFKGTLKQYVSNFLKPASDELHDAGEKVVSAGPAWNPDDVKEMINYGMLDMVDYVGFHPYANGVKLQKQRIQEVTDIVDGRKPMIATEWNVRGYEKDKATWASVIDDGYRQVHAGFALDYYFALFVVDTMAGPAGLMTKSGSHNTAFYNAFLEASHGVGSTPTTPTTPKPPVVDAPTPPVTNVPAAVETQIALYDTKTDRVISGYSNLKANQVIDLADLPTRNLAIVVIPSKKASSVKMTLNGKTEIQNTSPYAYFGENESGDLKAGDLGVGNYTMAVTPYTDDNASGTAFVGRSLSFRIKDTYVKPTIPTTPKPVPTSMSMFTPMPTPKPTDDDADKIAEVESFTLVDAKTGKAIKGYEHITKNMTISLASLSTRSLALLANLDEDAKSVKVSTRGVSKIENVSPYAFFSNNGKLTATTPTKGNTYHLSATAYDKLNGKGVKGSGLSVTLKFV
jgi:hypothetical protein